MNKLIILLNLTGSYIGGAQRRYINLFKELVKKRNDYYLMVNKSLYTSCIKDGILESAKNLIVIPVKFESYYNPNTKSTVTRFHKKNKLIILGGRIKYFLKLFISWILFNFNLYRIIKNYKIRIIYGVFTGGIWSWILSKILGIKFIYSYNDASISMISKKIIDFFNSEYWPIKYATKVDFLSFGIFQSLKDKLGDFQNERVLISPNSFIDYRRFFPVYPKKNVIAYCSRLTKYKNPELLIEVLSVLKEKGLTNLEVAIIGDGILLPNLKERAEKLELSNIVFYGGVSNPENILSKSSIFISIESDNNYPSQSLLEAMACENAIIASDVGETRLLVTENEGVLVKLNAEEIANAIIKLVNDPALTTTLGKNARKKVIKEHTIEKFVEYFYSITE